MLEESFNARTLAQSEASSLDVFNKDNRSFIIQANFTDQENIFTLTGRLTFQDCAEFEQAFENVELGDKEIILDLKDLDFIDSAGIGMLLILHERYNGLYIRGVKGEPEAFIKISKIIPDDHFL